ncbi:MAG: hypothetical protein KBH14_14930, partial [Vicinamibacteria bacterium]|nr:hypothetical protein [Vicinamibacteria bacterium]
LDPLRRRSTVVVGAFLSVPFIAAYESAIVLGPILAYAAFERLRGETAPSQRRAAAACLGSALLATLVALESIIRPTHPQNLAQFRESWKVVLEGGGTAVHLSLIVLVLALPWLQTKPWMRIITSALAGVACGVAVLLSLSDPIHMAVESQYRARIFNVVLPAVASVALLFSRRFSSSAAPGRNILGILFVAQVALQLQLTSQWSAFRQITREELACVRGLIPVDTAISRRLVERRVSREWMRGWNFPTLSFLDRHGALNAVLGVVDRGAPWQPFDPRNLDELPDLSRYGVDDREYREAMKRLLRSGGPTWERVSPCQGSRSPSPDSTPTANPNTR